VNPLRLAAALLIALAFGALAVPPAAASCATGSPEASPYAFVGTVIATGEGGRVAEVVTDEGEKVTVQGTEDTSWLSDSYTSVDRRYALGARYEFHPLNDESPYSDNACTATRKLSGPALSAFPETRAGGGVLPDWLPVDEQAGPIGYLHFFGPLTLGALALFALLRGFVHLRSADKGAQDHRLDLRP
jgi:hypothetical protein